MLPARKREHRAAVHQGGDVAAHAVVPVTSVRVELGGIGDGVAVGAQVCGHCSEGWEVEAGQAGHRPAEVDALHAASNIASIIRWPASGGTAFPAMCMVCR